MLLGSVVDRVVRASRIPVLVVPDDTRTVAMIPRRIVAPTDFSPASRRALASALTMAEEVGAALDVVHAYEVPRWVDRDAELSGALRSAMATAVRREHPELDEHPCARVRSHEGPAATVILGATEEASADLVLMATTGRGAIASHLFGGASDRVVRSSRVPVLLACP